MSTTAKSQTPTLALQRCFSIKEVCEHVGLSRRTITGALATGDLEHYRVGSRLVIPESAVVKWLESQRITKNPVEHGRWLRKHFPK